MMRALVCAAAAAVASAAGRVDAPLVTGVAPQYLDGEGWQVTADSGLTIGARVPGELLSDLHAAGVIGDPLFELNWHAMGSGALPVWDNQSWAYTTTFDASVNIAGSSWDGVLLVLDGVKMAADVTLNGQYLGFTADSFLRYTFPVAGALKQSGNVLTVKFSTSADPRNAEGRWSACSGGWDWAPYTNTANSAVPNGRTMSKGIWRSIYLSYSPASTPAITYIVPHVFYNGTYPTAPLTDAANGPWEVHTRVHFENLGAATVTGSLTVSGSWPGATPVTVQATVPVGNSSVTVVSTGIQNVPLWWPQGHGAQALHTVSVQWAPSGSGAGVVSDSRRIGFRAAYLVTADDSDPAALKGVDGSGNLTMRFKINGADIYARGGNIIPTDNIEARITAASLRAHVENAAAGGFNFFRVWGGGVYQFDEFYDAADELGIIMYHDVMYSGDGRLDPVASPMEDAEMRHQLRRISQHPSIALIDACNECGGGGIYDSFVMTTVAEEDASRVIWPSCPSNGWCSGVDRLTGLPNGNPVKTKPSSGNCAAAGVTEDGYTAPGCQFLSNLDFNPGPVKKVTDAASPADCCNQCTAAPAGQCYAAVFYQGSCYWKELNDTQYPVYSADRVAVWATSNGPAPPVPAPAATGVIEAHGPYQHGSGFPAVNGAASMQLFSANIPVNLNSEPIGKTMPGMFYSEFGASVFSGFESMSATLLPEHWGVQGGNEPTNCSGGGWPSTCTGSNPMSQRNYPCHSFIVVYFGNGVLASLNDTGAQAFQRQLYLCQLGQGLEMSSDILARRSGNQWGTSTWQMGEVWPTGGWGSLEYSLDPAVPGATPGQVIGGRWKPLHYFMAKTLYRDVLIVCGADSRCMVKNDNGVKPWSGNGLIQLVHLATGAVSTVASVPVALPIGAGVATWFCLDGSNATYNCPAMSAVLTNAGCAANGTDCVLLLSAVNGATGAADTTNTQLLAIPGALSLPAASVTASVASSVNPDGTVTITLTSTATALYVHLNTLAQGRFSDSAFMMTGAGSTTVSFIPVGGIPADLGLLTSTLRVEHLAQYI